MLKKTALLALGVVLTSLFIAIFLGEFIVRGVAPQITYKQARVVGLRIYEKSDVTPFTLQPNLQANHLGYTREFDHQLRTNNLGFRGDDISLEKPDNTYRILFLGDSMTFGWGVEDRQTFPARLQEYLHGLDLGLKFEVINAGFTDGYSPDSYYAFLRDRGLKLEPDLIILTFFPYNDIPDLLEMEWTKTDKSGLPLAVKSLDRTVKNGYQTFRAKTEWKYAIPLLKNSHLAMLLFQAMEKNTPGLVTFVKKVINVQAPPDRTNIEETAKCLYEEFCPEKFAQPFEQTEFILKGFRDLFEKNETRFLVLLMPSPDQAKRVAQTISETENPDLTSQQQPQKRFREYLETLDVITLDLLPTLADQNVKHYYYGRDGHLTPRGTKEVAYAIAQELALTQPTLLNNLTQVRPTEDLITQLNKIHSEIQL